MIYPLNHVIGEKFTTADNHSVHAVTDQTVQRAGKSGRRIAALSQKDLFALCFRIFTDTGGDFRIKRFSNIFDNQADYIRDIVPQCGSLLIADIPQFFNRRVDFIRGFPRDPPFSAEHQ